jgi:hypothetical protein
VWDADKQEALLEGCKVFSSAVACITTDEYGRCWVGSGEFAVVGWGRRADWQGP